MTTPRFNPRSHRRLPKYWDGDHAYGRHKLGLIKEHVADDFLKENGFDEWGNEKKMKDKKIGKLLGPNTADSLDPPTKALAKRPPERRIIANTPVEVTRITPQVIANRDRITDAAYELIGHELEKLVVKGRIEGLTGTESGMANKWIDSLAKLRRVELELEKHEAGVDARMTPDEALKELGRLAIGCGVASDSVAKKVNDDGTEHDGGPGDQAGDA